MTDDPASWFGGEGRVMFVHAHPDDETIATGGTLAALSEAGREPLLVTLTRGEQGEVVDGTLQALAQQHGLAVVRQNELKTALGMLGLERHAFLGVPPARAEGLEATIYEDSGMEWADQAGDGSLRAVPSSDVGPDALTSVPAIEPLYDLLAAGYLSNASAIVSYDHAGGYGHPDHVLAHQLGRAVAEALEIPFWEIVADHEHANTEGVEVHDVAPWLERKVAALRAHATQLTVESGGPHYEIMHVGGQRQRVEVVEAFRRVVR